MLEDFKDIVGEGETLFYSKHTAVVAGMHALHVLALV